MKRWTASKLEASTWYPELKVLIADALTRRHENTPDRRPALLTDAEKLERQNRGWSQSLGNPDLPLVVRRQIEADMAVTQSRLTEIQTELIQLDAAASHSAIEISADDVAARLNRLTDSLAATDPTRTNLELSMHIDKIVGFDDGRVTVRTCRLGAIAEAVECLADFPAAQPATMSTANGIYKARPRRRARLRVGGEDDQGNNLDDTVHFVTDVHRFAGLGPEWFTEDEFRIPEPTCWAKENAAAVAARRKAGLTHAELSIEFQVSIPTIRHALRIAGESDETLKSLPRKMPRACWPEEHYSEVATMWHQGLRVKELMAHFKKSQTLLREALRLAGLGGRQNGRGTDAKRSA